MLKTFAFAKCKLATVSLVGLCSDGQMLDNKFANKSINMCTVAALLIGEFICGVTLCIRILKIDICTCFSSYVNSAVFFGLTFILPLLSTVHIMALEFCCHEYP